jgi:hypothetical protein
MPKGKRYQCGVEDVPQAGQFAGFSEAREGQDPAAGGVCRNGPARARFYRRFGVACRGRPHGPLPSAEGLFCRLSDPRKQEVLIRKSQ